MGPAWRPGPSDVRPSGPDGQGARVIAWETPPLRPRGRARPGGPGPFVPLLALALIVAAGLAGSVLIRPTSETARFLDTFAREGLVGAGSDAIVPAWPARPLSGCVVGPDQGTGAETLQRLWLLLERDFGRTGTLRRAADAGACPAGTDVTVLLVPDLHDADHDALLSTLGAPDLQAAVRPSQHPLAYAGAYAAEDDLRAAIVVNALDLSLPRAQTARRFARIALLHELFQILTLGRDRVVDGAPRSILEVARDADAAEWTGTDWRGLLAGAGAPSAALRALDRRLARMPDGLCPDDVYALAAFAAIPDMATLPAADRRRILDARAPTLRAQRDRVLADPDWGDLIAADCGAGP